MFAYLRIIKFPMLFIVFAMAWTGFFLVNALKGNASGAGIGSLLLCAFSAMFLYASDAIFSEIYEACTNQSKNTIARSDSFILTMLILLLAGLLFAELAGLVSLILACAFVFAALFRTVYRIKLWVLSRAVEGLLYAIVILIGISFIDSPFSGNTGLIVFAMLVFAVDAFLLALMESPEMQRLPWKWVFALSAVSGLMFFIVYLVMPAGERMSVTILTFTLMIVWYMFGLKFSYSNGDIAVMSGIGKGMIAGLCAIMLFAVSKNMASLFPAMAVLGLAAGYGISSFLITKFSRE